MIKGVYCILLLGLVAIDRLTKLSALAHLDYGVPVPVSPFFNLTLLYNPGAAFSFFAESGPWAQHFLSIFALLVSVILIILLWRLPKRARLLGFCYTLILAGALGNVWDRLLYGYVVDFIQLYWNSFYWPAFNIADAAISCGIVLLLMLSFKRKPA